MSLKESGTAILLFARSTKVERESKRLSSRKVSMSVFKALNRRTAKIADRTSFPVFRYDEHQQTGETFAERITDGIEAIFAKGFDNLVIIGNDCPDLKTIDLLKAGSSLHNDQCVIGPDQRGGTFLIGITQRSYSREDFLNLHWQKSSLVDSLIRYFDSEKLDFEFLEAKADINTLQDLKDYLVESVWLLKRLIRLFSAPYFSLPRVSPHYVLQVANPSLRRGPPRI